MQIRVTLPKEEGEAFYEDLMASDHAQAVAEHLQRNNNIGFRYQYLTLNGEKHCDITYVGDRVLTLGPDPTEAPTPTPAPTTAADYLMNHLLWIVICAVELVAIVVLIFIKQRKVKEEKQPLV